jgi:hypothetical protein
MNLISTDYEGMAIAAISLDDLSGPEPKNFIPKAPG